MIGFELLDEFQKFIEEARSHYPVYKLTPSIEDFTYPAEVNKVKLQSKMDENIV